MLPTRYGGIVATHVELYEALKPHVGREAAQMIADVVPPASNLATKDDIQALRGDIFKWGLVFFVPLWLGVWGTLAALAVQLVRG
jgi:hypothetical protein